MIVSGDRAQVSRGKVSRFLPGAIHLPSADIMSLSLRVLILSERHPLRLRPRNQEQKRYATETGDRCCPGTKTGILQKKQHLRLIKAECRSFGFL